MAKTWRPANGAMASLRAEGGDERRHWKEIGGDETSVFCDCRERSRRIMKSGMWKLLAVVVVVAMLVPALAACGPTPEPEIIKETVVVTEKETVIVTEKEEVEVTKVVVEKEEVEVEVVVTATPEPRPEGPVEMRVGTTFILDTSNINVSWTSWGIWRQIYDSIVETAELGIYRPGIAEEWSVSEDGLTWTFKIREGMTFHDGTPLTAEEVAWSLNWMINVENDSLSYLWWNFEQVVALDETTLQITTGTPVGNMEYLLFWAFIVPESVWGQFDNYDDMSAFSGVEAMVGSGPFRVTDFVPDEYLIMEANEGYWEGKPAIDKLIYQQYATEDAMVQALLAGEVDVVELVPGAAVPTLLTEDNIAVEVMQGHALDTLAINSHEDGTQPESLNDPVVRKAIEYAIDRQKLIEVAYLGYGDPGKTMIAPSLTDWHNTEIDYISFDLEEANRILDEAGYVDSDNDGVREWSDGSPLEYRLMATEGATYARMLEIISDGLAQAGISAPPTLLDFDSQAALAYNFDFDMNMWYWGMDIDPDFGMVIFKCSEREGWGWNPNGYCDEHFEELYVAQATETDFEKRQEIVWEAQEQIYNDRPWIVLVYPKNISAYRSDRFTGFRPEAKYLLGKWSLLQAEPVY
jgi:peptide/nickel transport system substrate-binding protein